MKSSMMALAVGVALAGCSTGDGNVFASRDKTVEYYRVFDIKADPSNPAVVKAASEGISRHIADATLATPSIGADLQEQPGRFKLADPTAAAPGTAMRGLNCEGAAWTARATPRVNGGDNMNMIACLFPYKNGYHLDMYAVFTEKEGGWLEWPRRFTGRLMGTPEKWTDQTMVDVVRSIRDSTGAQVALVEARPALAGEPWLQIGPSGVLPSGSASNGATGMALPAMSHGANGSGGSGASAAAGTAASPVPNPASAIAPMTPASTPAPSPTPTQAPAPTPASPIAVVPMSTPSSQPSTPPTTIATGDTDTKTDKTDVK